MPASRSRVASERNTWCGVPFVMPSSRAAVLVVSPIAVYSSRRSEPTLPDITWPVLSPMPIANALAVALLGHPRVERGRAARPAISRAAATARSAWSGCSSGAPNTAMIPSPM